MILIYFVLLFDFAQGKKIRSLSGAEAPDFFRMILVYFVLLLDFAQDIKNPVTERSRSAGFFQNDFV